MHRKAKKERSAVQNLDTLAKLVKSALYEAEDILDLIGYHQIEKDVIGGKQQQMASAHRRSHPRLQDELDWEMHNHSTGVGTEFVSIATQQISCAATDFL